MTAPPSESLRLPNIALLLGLSWLVIVGQLLAAHWAETAQTLLDTDDAMRLVQMREFLAGRGWFDLHEMRLGPPDGYDTHWSRLIDGGLAGMYLIFHQFADTALAERLVRTIWPMLWLLPTMAGAAAIAWRIAGTAAIPFVCLMTVVGQPAFRQFVPGRIDHHNVQLALSVLLIAATAWSDRVRFAAAAAGVLTGAALAIGFEGLPFVVLVAGAMALRFLSSPEGARPLAHYGLGAAASIAVAFAISVGPSHWGRTACDAIAINSVAAAIVATLGLVIAATTLTGAGWRARAVGVAASGIAGSAVFLAIEPQCIGGPFAMMHPLVRSLWFVHVSEMESLWRVATASVPRGAAFAAFPIIGVLCGFAAARDRDTRRDFGFAVAAVALAMAVALTIGMIRAQSYAEWFAIPMVATGALLLCALFRLNGLAARAFVALLLTPAVTSALALATLTAVTHPPVEEQNGQVAEVCRRSDTYVDLARLPPGRVATDIDNGPFVLALTPHSVLSAPYHRLTTPIIAAHRIFALPPGAAREVVAEAKPDYLVVCGRAFLGGIGEAERAVSLWGRLAAGDVPDWLEQVAETRDRPLVIYRVKR
jgi:hypothetical protein